MSDTCSLYPPFGDSCPSCRLPSQNQQAQGIPIHNPRRRCIGPAGAAACWGPIQGWQAGTTSINCRDKRKKIDAPEGWTLDRVSSTATLLSCKMLKHSFILENSTYICISIEEHVINTMSGASRYWFRQKN